MNNNNIYFSCFSLIRACVSSLFANFYKVVCVCLVVCFVLCSPLAAFAGTTESMMMYSVSPRAVNDGGAHFYFSGGLYNSDLLKNMDSVESSSLLSIDDDMFGEYFTGSTSYRRTMVLSEDYTDKNFDYVKYTIELKDADNLGLSFGDVEISFGTLRFALRNSSNNYLNFTSNDLSHISYQYAYDITGSESDEYVYENEKTLNKSSLTGTIATPLDQSDIRFKAQFPKSIEIDGTTVTYAKGLKINFYLKTDRLFDWLGTNGIDALVCGFSNSPSCYFSYDYLGTGGNISNPQDKQDQEELLGGLTNINTSITNGLSNVVGSITNMANQAWQSAQQTVQSISNMTTQLTNTLNQQRQDILDGLGLLGDDITGTLGSVKTEITNIGSSITNKIESTTETITNTIENKVDEVTTAVDNVKQSVTEVKQSILDLPNKIKEMLLGLIVPDSETLANKYTQFSQLLENKLGVIYQIPAMILELFNTLLSGVTDPQTTLTFPSLSLPWIDGTQMKLWDSIEFEIIPTGMDVLKELIQTVTSMVCVIMTFNSVKRIYENFLRGR